MVAARAPERDIYLAQVIEQVDERLVAARIEAQVTGRPKHLYSIYEKMVLKNKEFDEIYDLVGVRVIVSSVKDCWAALGAIHGTWAPVQGRFKDYINTPKFNLYQSLHTTVVGPQGKPLEVQIRTIGNAQPGRVRDRRPLGLQGERLGGRRRLVAADRGLVGGEHRPGRVPRELEARPGDRRGLRLHPQGRRRRPAGRRHPGRLCLLHPHRGRATAASGPGSTAASSRWIPS